MFTMFTIWLDKNGKLLSIIAALTAILQFAFLLIKTISGIGTAAANWTDACSHGLQFIFLVIVAGYLFVTGKDRRPQEGDRDDCPERKFVFWIWFWILATWALFYVSKLMFSAGAPVAPSMIEGWFPNLLNRIPTVLFFCLYLLFSNRLFTISGRCVLFLSILTLLSLTIFDAGLHSKRDSAMVALKNNNQITQPNAEPAAGTSVSDVLKEYHKLNPNNPMPIDSVQAFVNYIGTVQTVASVIDCMAIIMVIGRLDSKLLLLPPGLLAILYFYGPLQVLFSTAIPSLILFLVAFLSKAVLVLTFAWLLSTEAICFYLRSMQQIEEGSKSAYENPQDSGHSSHWKYSRDGD